MNRPSDDAPSGLTGDPGESRGPGDRGDSRTPEVRRVETAATRPVLTALRSMKGRATLGDVVAATGLVRDEAEAALRQLLEERRGHLEVGADGTLVYRFDPSFIRRGAEPAWEKVKRVAWSAFQVGFKLWIAFMLVFYFVLFVVLLIAALLKSDDDIDLGGGGGRGGHRHRGGHFPSFWFWYLIWSPDWHRGRRYYGHDWEEQRKLRVPFWKKVFAFVFGPDRPVPNQAQKDRSVVRLIRARRGVLTVAELVEHTGLTVAEAEEEMARLMVTLGGDVEVSDDGVLLYTFPELMTSAHGPVVEREPTPAWRRLEPKSPLTGNATGTNAIIGGINAFNLIAAATAPLFIFPRLGFSGTAAWVVLVWIPVVFSTLFFGIPLARWWSVSKENVKRGARNLRKVLVGFVYRDTLEEDRAIRPAEAVVQVREVLSKEVEKAPKKSFEAGDVESELVRLTAEFDGEVSASEDGVVEYRFPEIRRQYVAGEAARSRLRLEEREVGPIVYDSEDTVEEGGRRDIEAFDRELEAGDDSRDSTATADEIPEGAPIRMLPSPDRVAYFDEIDLVAFDEEMKQRT